MKADWIGIHWPTIAASVVTALVGGCGLVWWLSQPYAGVVERRVPVTAAPAAVALARVDIEGQFTRYAAKPSAIDASWPRFRGETYDNISRDTVPLASTWLIEGPPVLWEVELGEGHAGAAVANGCVYVLDYDEERRRDALRCFSLGTGEEIWERSYAVQVKRNHGMSRTVPTVTESVVVSMGPRCHVMCVDAQTGAFRWGMDLVKDFGAEVPLWYTAQCPLVDSGDAVLAPAGTVLMMAVNGETGAVRWQAPNARGWKMSHSSIIPMTLCGRRTAVYCALGGVVGVALDEPDRGRILWETTEWNPSVVAPSPVALGDDRILVTAGYGAGSMLLKVEQDGDGYAVRVLQRFDKSVFAAEQQTPVYFSGYCYSVLPKDAGAGREQAVCMSPDGQRMWLSGKEHRFGLGPFVVADEKLFILDDAGRLTVAAVSASGYRPLASADVLDGRDAWGPIAVAAGRLILRDSRRMVCLDVSKRIDPEGVTGDGEEYLR